MSVPPLLLVRAGIHWLIFPWSQRFSSYLTIQPAASSFLPQTKGLFIHTCLAPTQPFLCFSGRGERGEGCKADIQPFSGAIPETTDSESLRHTSRPFLLYSSSVLLSTREQGFYLPRLHREETQMSRPYFSSLPGTITLLTCLRTR